MKNVHIQNILYWTGVGSIAFFCLAPIIWMIVVSLGESPYFITKEISYAFTLDHYRAIIFGEGSTFLLYLRNSLIIASVSGILSTLFATLAAYAVTRMTFPGRFLIPLIMLSMSMFPQISIAGYLFRLMARTGLINTYAALILPYTAVSLSLGLWIMMSYFSQLPIELDKAALIDGASKLDVLYKILFPIAVPGILSTFLLTFIFSFNEFILALMMTFDYHARTVPVGIALFQGMHGQTPWGSIMAAATISSLPLIIITIIFNRYIIRGLTEGALKG